jgi:hypothetical protein
LFGGSIAAASVLIIAATSRAAEPASENPRYGLFGLLDSRSMYGKGVFPEPFIVDDSDLEVNEFRLDWNHQQGKGQQTNLMTVEVEKGFGNLTLEVEAPYEYDTSNIYNAPTGHVDHQRIQGVDAIDLGARYPFYQYVSDNNFVDSTFGVALEVGVPSNSPLGKNAEIVPKIFDDLRLGDHFTAQCILGYSFLRGAGDEGGQQHFEYGFVFGWTISHDELPIPDVEQIIPVLELSGETLLNTHEGGANSLTGNLALRANLQSIGRIQPRLGIGYLFPIDQGARDDFHWGIHTSLLFEF